MIFLLDFSAVGFTVQCVDGGYFFILEQEPVACRNAADVLALAGQQLEVDVPKQWDSIEPISVHHAVCVCARVRTAHQGTAWAITWGGPKPPHMQFLRFNRGEVLAVIARWMGLVAAVAPQPDIADDRPPLLS